MLGKLSNVAIACGALVIIISVFHAMAFVSSILQFAIFCDSCLQIPFCAIYIIIYCRSWFLSLVAPHRSPLLTARINAAF
jgi:hypothetical protein